MLLGWIKLHRQLLDNWVMTEPEALSVWVRFLLEANHETKKKMLNGSLVEIKRGQLIFGLEAFSARSGITISKLRRYLKLLESEGMINRLKTAKYSIITIASFDSYQNDDRQSAGKRQSNSKQITTPKECKNDNNENINITSLKNDGFDHWWDSYPKKSSKPAALKAFRSKTKNMGENSFFTFVDMLINDSQKRYEKTDRQFIPNPSTYLNQEKYNDERN